MARRAGRRSSERDTLFANPVPDVGLLRSLTPRPVSIIDAYADRPLTTPSDVPFRRSDVAVARPGAPIPPRGLPADPGASVWQRASICASRQQRKEVIHALGLAGRRGGGGGRPRRRSWKSDVGC